MATLGSERRRKACSYLNTEDRVRSITAGLLIRLLEKRYATEMYIGPFGKPLMRDDTVQFNISHSGNLVVCAVSDRPVGVDVQTIEEFDDGLLAHILTPSEREIFDKNRSNTLFTDIWASKESYVKAVGTGLYTEPTTFTVLTEKGLTAPDDRMRFTYPGSDMRHRLCICHDRKDPTVAVKRIGYPELMSGC
ncbi:MAG: 4'-phosphopantetheinyl transferase superfamily protein [archaeon]|nr:4'-phosphopantetheinyl transferase superfamily protein [archaeon]